MKDWASIILWSTIDTLLITGSLMAGVASYYAWAEGRPDIAVIIAVVGGLVWAGIGFLALRAQQ